MKWSTPLQFMMNAKLSKTKDLALLREPAHQIDSNNTQRAKCGSIESFPLLWTLWQIWMKLSGLETHNSIISCKVSLETLSPRKPVAFIIDCRVVKAFNLWMQALALTSNMGIVQINDNWLMKQNFWKLKILAEKVLQLFQVFESSIPLWPVFGTTMLALLDSKKKQSILTSCP